MKRANWVAAALIMSGAVVPPASGIAMAADAPAAKTAAYSVSSTQIGTLLDDPAAAAVLKRMIPTVYANEMFQQNGRPLTLKDVQQYEPDALSDANLAKIQAELDKLPPKR
jgi:hypothetical protein